MILAVSKILRRCEKRLIEQLVESEPTIIDVKLRPPHWLDARLFRISLGGLVTGGTDVFPDERHRASSTAPDQVQPLNRPA